MVAEWITAPSAARQAGQCLVVSVEARAPACGPLVLHLDVAVQQPPLVQRRQTVSGLSRRVGEGQHTQGIGDSAGHEPV